MLKRGKKTFWKFLEFSSLLLFPFHSLPRIGNFPFHPWGASIWYCRPLTYRLIIPEAQKRRILKWISPLNQEYWYPPYPSLRRFSLSLELAGWGDQEKPSPSSLHTHIFLWRMFPKACVKKKQAINLKLLSKNSKWSKVGTILEIKKKVQRCI